MLSTGAGVARNSFKRAGAAAQLGASNSRPLRIRGGSTILPCGASNTIGLTSSIARSFAPKAFQWKVYNATHVRTFSIASDVPYRPQITPQGPFNEKIKTFISKKEYPEALAVFEEMTSNSVSPDETTFALLALSIAHMNPRSSFEYLLKISEQYSTLLKPSHPIRPGKTILSRLAQKMKTTVDAPRASTPQSPIRMSHISDEELAESRAVEEPISFFESQNVALSGIFKVWIENKAPDVLVEFLLHHHTKPRIPDVVLALEQCIKYRKPEDGWKVYLKWRGECASPQLFHLAVVLNAEQVLADMSKALVDEKTSLARIQAVKDDMVEANQLPSYQTQAYLLRHWSSVSRPQFVFSLFESMTQDPYIADSMRMSDYNVVLNQYAMQKMVPEAEQLFDSLRSHPRLKLDTAIYTTMIKAYARVEDAPKAWALVGEMVRHGRDPAVYQKHASHHRSHEVDVWPSNVTMSVLLDMEARVNGPLALIETFESIRTTYHLTPSLNNWGALLEQLALQKQYIALFDWFITMMRTQSLKVSLKECCYLTLLDPSAAPFSDEQRAAVTGIKWNTKAEAPPLTNEERRKWIATAYRWKDMYTRNNSLNPPPELDLIALHKIRDQLSHPSSPQDNSTVQS